MGGEVVAPICRYHDVLLGPFGRRLVRDEFTRYEAVAVGLVSPHQPEAGKLRTDWPPPDSPLHVARFFETLYAVYDLRFQYAAASVRALQRLGGEVDSPAAKAIREAGEPESVLGCGLRLT